MDPSAKNSFQFSKNKLSILFAAAALVIVGVACSKTPPPAAYVGVWTGADGTLITIYSDGTGDYKSGSSSVSGGSTVINEAAKTLKISFASMGPTFTIDKAPSGNEMTLSGVVFKKGGGSSSDSKSENKSTSSADTKATGTKSDIPADDKLQSMVKTTMFDFSDAVQKGDFSDFHKKVAKVWQDQTTPAELLENFQAFVDDKANFDFKKALGSSDATFSPAPSFEKIQGLDALVLSGTYPTKPQQTHFELKYIMEGGSWKLVGIRIRTKAD